MPGIAQVIDSTDAGGAERLAVELANAVAQDGHPSHLIVARHLGALTKEIDVAVNVLTLNKTYTLDFKAISRTINYIRKHDIRILHAHGRTNAYWSALWKLLGKLNVKVIFHDHTGGYDVMPGWKLRIEEYLDRLILRKIDGILCVSKPLKERNSKILSGFGMPVKQINNGVSLQVYDDIAKTAKQKYIIQVANLSPQKGYENIAFI